MSTRGLGPRAAKLRRTRRTPTSLAVNFLRKGHGGEEEEATRLGERHLLLDDAVGDGHRRDEVDKAGRVAPLVVVPGDELDEGRREHDARARVEDGRAGLADEVRRHDLWKGRKGGRGACEKSVVAKGLGEGVWCVVGLGCVVKGGGRLRTWSSV